jgi:GrpB-like predicted nucleotidyltransferase (UPF0157 family)
VRSKFRRERPISHSETLEDEPPKPVTSGEQPVEVVDYDASWPLLFQAERDALARVLARWLAGPIEHIGSTAIPGLAAKPVVDIMAAVSRLEGSRPAIQAAAELGYCYFPYRPESEHWFCKPSPLFRTHHLHLVPVGSPQFRETIAFRDYLRTHPAIAADYEALKRQLARECHFDREAYTNAKRPFIDRIIKLAREQAT